SAERRPQILDSGRLRSCASGAKAIMDQLSSPAGGAALGLRERPLRDWAGFSAAALGGAAAASAVCLAAGLARHPRRGAGPGVAGSVACAGGAAGFSALAWL